MRGGYPAGFRARAHFRTFIKKRLPGRHRADSGSGLKAHSAETRLRLLQHELRTPLTGILGMAEMLQASMLSGEQQRLLVALRESGRQLERLLAGLVTGIPAMNSVQRASFQAFDGPRFMEQIIRSHWPAALEKGIGLCLVVDHRLPELWVSELAWLRQILDNLLANAIKFTPSGHVLLEARCCGDTDAGQGDMELCVVDTGIGVADHDGRRIYRAGDRGNLGIGEHYGGSGLGLYVCQQLASCLGARLLHGPSGGGGTRFELTLPGAGATNREGTDRLRAGLLAGLNCQLALSEPWDRVVANLLHRMGVRVESLERHESGRLPARVDAVICDAAAVSTSPTGVRSMARPGGPVLLTHQFSPGSFSPAVQQVSEVTELPQPLLQSNLEPLLLRLALQRRMQRSERGRSPQ